MLTRLREAIDEVEILPVAGELKEALELRSRLDAKISSAVGDFDAAGLYELDQATSMTAWLRHEARMTSRDAGRMTSIAKRLPALPVTRRAWAVSAGQVQAVVANVSRRIEHLFAQAEEHTVPYLATRAVKDVAGVMQEWAAQANDSLDPDQPTPPPEPERALHLSMLLEGRYRLDADLDAEGGSLTEVAIRLAETPDGPADRHRPRRLCQQIMRGPSREVGDRRRRDQPRQPGARLSPSPPPVAQRRLGVEALAQRRATHHRPRRPYLGDKTTAITGAR